MHAGTVRTIYAISAAIYARMPAMHVSGQTCVYTCALSNAVCVSIYCILLCVQLLPTPICYEPLVNHLVYRYLPLVTQVSPDLYISFKKAYLENRAAVVSGQMSCESVLELVSTTPLGSLGGLSTSSNVSEVFGARYNKLKNLSTYRCHTAV
jgi:hypothetical protein